MENNNIKKLWMNPEIILISTADVNAKNLGSNEAYYSKTVPIGVGSYKFYHNGVYQGVGSHKLASILS